MDHGTWEGLCLYNEERLIISLRLDDDNSGISCTGCQDVASMDKETLATLKESGAEIISYQGKQYVMHTGFGDPCYYEISADTVTVHLGMPEDGEPDYFTLTRRAKDKLTATDVHGFEHFGITENMVFTYQT